MYTKVMATERTGKKPVVNCEIKKISLEEVETIRDALAVLTEEKAERAGITWNSEGTREKLLLSFIGVAENMRGFENGKKQI